MSEVDFRSDPEEPGTPFALPFIRILRSLRAINAGVRDAHTLDVSSDHRVAGFLRSYACPLQMAEHDEWCLKRFLRVEKIGSGLASSVYRVLDSVTNTQCALKVYDMRRLNRALQDSVMQEIAIHGRIHHPHVLSFYAAFIDTCYLCILLELAPSSDLYKRMPEIRRDEGTVTKYVIGPLIFTLAYMHQLNIVHRDIKPENVLLRCSHILLSDFGFAINVTKQRPVTRLGTLHFMAPELLLNDPGVPGVRREKVARQERKEYGKEVDIWAVGVLAYELFTRRAPFDGETEDAVIDLVTSNAAVSFPENVSANAVDFIRRCLERDPARRPTAAELTRHPLITANMSAERIRDLDPAIFLPRGRTFDPNHPASRRFSLDGFVRRTSGGMPPFDPSASAAAAAAAAEARAEQRAAMHSQMVSRPSNGSHASLGLSPGFAASSSIPRSAWGTHPAVQAEAMRLAAAASAPHTPVSGTPVHHFLPSTPPALPATAWGPPRDAHAHQETSSRPYVPAPFAAPAQAAGVHASSNAVTSTSANQSGISTGVVRGIEPAESSHASPYGQRPGSGAVQSMPSASAHVSLQQGGGCASGPGSATQGLSVDVEQSSMAVDGVPESPSCGKPKKGGIISRILSFRRSSRADVKDS